jgi:1-aminocyclopropane-1-carboxylate deaminase
MNEINEFFTMPSVSYNRLTHQTCASNDVIVDIKRLDLLHPHINGNKGYKLKYNVLKALEEGHKTIITFGGAWSNHIYATAAAGREFGIKTIGIIRGEEPKEFSTTLQFAREQGMQLVFVSRLDYEDKNTEEFKAWLHDQFGSFHLVPEGGSNYYGINGCMEILSASDKLNYDIIACSCGTGATLAGLVLSAKTQQKIIGFSALHGGEFLHAEVLKHIEYTLMNKELAEEFASQFNIETRYHFGGYGKWNDELLEFIQSMRQSHDLPLDQVYTAKAFYGLLDRIEKKEIAPASRVLFLHTGGLQGTASITTVS